MNERESLSDRIWRSPSPSDILADVNAMLAKVGDEMQVLPKPLPKGYRMNQATYDSLTRFGTVLLAENVVVPFAFLKFVGVDVRIDNTLKDGETKEAL